MVIFVLFATFVYLFLKFLFLRVEWMHDSLSKSYCPWFTLHYIVSLIYVILGDVHVYFHIKEYILDCGIGLTLTLQYQNVLKLCHHLRAKPACTSVPSEQAVHSPVFMHIDLPLSVHPAVNLSICRLTKQWNLGASMFYGHISSCLIS
jgi:hypothetical protein